MDKDGVKAVFLDRDGVINEDRDDYVKNIRELVIFPYVPESVRRLNEAGFDVVVISNQQGVAKGLIPEDDLRGIQNEITRQVTSGGGKISEFYYCKHLAAEQCVCRKPQSGMLIEAARERGISLSDSYMVGDADRDIIAGSGAGCTTVLVLSGKFTCADLDDWPCKPDFVADDLAKAVDWIVAEE